MSAEWITFKGIDYLLIDSDESGMKNGPIATPGQYENFVPSYAYLRLDGKVVRFREVIGTIDDIVFTGKYYE
jgi:hypothetical protein